MKKPTILFVDDIEMFRELGERFLANCARVITCSRGEEALTAAVRERPALVISDLHMPGMDGADLCRAIKSHPDLCSTPVLMIITTPDTAERNRALCAGADDLLRKPLSRPGLVQAATRFLRYQSTRDLPRIPLSAPIHMMAREGESWGTVCNLSRRGMFVETQQAMAPQTLVNLHFTLPERSMELLPIAQVMWRRVGNKESAGMGLRFLELDGTTAHQLEDYVFERSLESQRSLAGTPS